MKGKRQERQRNASTAVSAADPVLLSMTQIKSLMFQMLRRWSKLLTLLTMEARLGVESGCDYADLFMASMI